MNSLFRRFPPDMKDTTMKRKHRAHKTALHCIEEMERRVLLSVAAGTAQPIAVLRFMDQPTANGLASPDPTALTPAEIRGAYGISSISFNGITGDGTGQAIAIVDAYDDPNAQSDLSAFDTQYNLPDPVFEKLNQEGQPGPYPTTDPNASPLTGSWEEEESLDIEWAHVIAPGAEILLFEANDPSAANLYLAVDAARDFSGVSVVSMSFDGAENAAEVSQDGVFTTPSGHTGVTFLAAAGDAGIYAPVAGGSTRDVVTPVYPASSPNVIAVGGTTLTTSGDNYSGETGWGNGTNSDIDGGGGGGISIYEPQPSYQKGIVTQSTTQRTYPDVSMNADPASGVAVYDSFDFSGPGSWIPGTIGGTSLATPTWAGLIAITNQGRVLNGSPTLDGATQTLPALYKLPSADFHDITTGNNGYAAGQGYDLVTGLGSPVANLLVPGLVGASARPEIGDFVFDDINANGIQDSGEPGLGGVTVDLDSPGPDGLIGGGDDYTVQTTTTDDNGIYHFNGFAAGTYYVHFHLLPNFNFSPPFQGSDTGLDSNVDPTTGDSQLIVVSKTTVNDTIDCGMYAKTLSINNVSMDEGNSGLTPFVFTVNVTPVPSTLLLVSYSTADGTATVADNDYLPVTNGVLVFAPGVSQQTITIDVVGDTKIENNEFFSVILVDPAGFSGGNTTGVGTIINDDFPVVTVTSGPAQVRPNTGLVDFPFTVTLSAPAPFDVFVPYSTQDATAVSGYDYQATSGTLDFTPTVGSTPGETSIIVNVPVIGGTAPELNKRFFFDVQGSSTAVLGNPSQAVGSILSNSPPSLGVANSQVTESLTGTALLPFVVTLAPALGNIATVNYTTADGTAIAGLDYQAVSGTLTFQPGQLQQTIFVPVFRRFLSAEDKTLTFTLSDVTSVGTILLSSPVAVGTIHDLATATLPFNSTTKATYTDYLNNRVSVSLKGLGNGTVVFLGSQSTATDAYLILVNGSDSGSSLLVKTTGTNQTTFHDIIITGSMGSILGKTSNLMDQLTVSGSLNSLTLDYLAAAKITVGAGTGTLGLTFSRVLDTSITSAIPIRSLTATDYLNTDGVPDLITAPDVNTIKIKGNFQGTLVTQEVDQVQVGGSIEGASLLVSNSIGNVTAASISNSTIFAGVRSDETALPSAASDFVNTQSRISSVKVNHGGFSNTLIAAWKIGALSLGSVQTADSGTDFGVTENQLASITAFTTSPLDITKLTSDSQPVIDADFNVRTV